MRNEDASQAGLNQSATVDARDDADHLAANEYGPAVGNTITGAGTITGATGTDSPLGANAHIVAVQGAGGSDTSFEDGKLVVEGQYGTLTIDADGNYSYARHPGTPAGVSDVFTYTLADDAGASDLAKLIINIGDVPMLQAEGSQTIQTANGVVVLPAGVELSDVRVVGRDLVVTLPDGSTMVIPDGAIFVPQLVIDGVEVPASNLAALLIGSEPKPAAGDLAGSQQSSGGNFEVPVAPLDPGVPLGDLLPPTELNYTPPEFEEIGQFIKEDTQPLAGVVSVQLDDDDIPGKGGNPGGVGDDEGSPNAVASGFLPGSEGDGALTWDFLATGAPAGFTYNLLGDGTLQVLQQQGGSNVVVLSISINHSTGAFTATEVNPIWHAPGADENNVQFAINYTVTDSDGDIAAGVLNIDVDDDTPTASGNGEFSAALVVDESPVGQDEGGDHDPNGVRSASANFAGAFSGGSFGADGPLGGTVADGTSYTLILSSQGASSGLYALDSSDTVADSDGIGQGQEILLYSNGGVIEGRVGGSSGTLYFTISVSSTGTVTFTQIDGANVWHANTGSDDDTSSLSAAPGTILLQQTLTDADNDSASSNFDLSDDVFQIEDDGPTQPTLNGEFSGSLVVDESPVGADEGGDNAPAGVRSASGDFSGAFGAVTLGSFGTDGPLGGTVADGTSYALDLSSEGIASGLYALGVGGAQGAAIELYTALDGSIEGRVGGAMGTLYFTISVDSTGVVTFTQEDGANVWHSNTGSDDDTSYLNIDVEDGSLHLVQTLTDADGDTDSNSFDLSDDVFQIEDDGPTQPTLNGEFSGSLVVDESPVGADEGGDNAPAGVRSASGDFSGAFGAVTLGSFGTDGPLGGTVADGTSYALDLSSEGIASGLYALGVGGAQGAAIELYTALDGSIEGRVGGAMGTLYFTISVDSTGVVTFTQEDGANVWHSNTGSDDDTSYLNIDVEDGSLHLVQTLTDADGDTDSNSFDLSDDVFQIEDDGPTQPTLNGEFSGSLVVDESPVGADEGGDNAPAGVRSASGDFSGAFGAVTLGSFGTDGPLGGTVADGTSYALDLSSEGIASGLYALGVGGAQGAAIELYTALDGSIEGRVGGAMGTLYFTISVDSTGVVTFTQEDGANVWHSNTGSDDDTSYLNIDVEDGSLHLVQTLTDADGDTDSNSFDLSDDVFQIEDDGPTQPTLNGEFSGSLVVDESPVGADEGGDNAPAGVRSASGDFSGAFGAVTLGSFGTDGPLGGTVADGTSYALDLSSEGIASGLYALGVGGAQGAAIELYTALDGSIEGRVGGAMGTLYFTISVDSTGVVTFTQEDGANVWHSNTGSDDDTSYLNIDVEDGSLHLVQTLTDADGDTDSNSFDLSDDVFQIEDDGPTQPTLNGEFSGSLVVDESPVGADEGGDNAPAGVRSASGDFSGAFGAVTLGSFGTDGPLGGTVADGTSYALDLSSEGIASGLYALGVGGAQGAAIELYTALDGSIEGRVGGAMGTLYFTISVDSTGVVTFTQEDGANVWHSNTGSDDDTSYLNIDVEDGSLHLVQTLTDADGDTDSNSFDLSDDVFQIEDDGPTQPTLNGEFSGSLVVDESPVGADEGGDNAPAGVRSASGDFSGAFGAVTLGSFGTDGPLGGTVADGTSYALDLSSEGIASGLYALGVGGAQGAAIELYTALDGSIEGRVGGAMGTLYFTISVDSTGVVTFTQEDGANVWHSNTGSDDDTSYLNIDVEDGSLHLVQTLTDADGDTDSNSFDLSDDVFQIEDDGPTQPTLNGEFSGSLVVDESPVGADEGGDNAPAGVRSASGDFSGAFGAVTLGSFGTDGPLGGTVADGTSYALDLSSEGIASGLYALGVGGAQGAAIELYTALDGSIEGRVGGAMGTLYFTISVDSTGVVTFTQEDGANVWHSNTGSDDDTSYLNIDVEDGSLHLVQTLTDADGDTDSNSFDLSDDVFQIEDDGPTQPTLNGEFSGSLVVDESPVGADEGGDNAPAGVRSASGDFSGAFGAVTLGSFGTDGPLGGTVADGTSYALDLSSEGIASGLYALGVGGAQGAAIELYTALDGSIEGRVGGAMGTLYFTISVDSTGVVTFTQEDGANVWHSNTGSDDDTSYLNIDVEDGSLHLVQTLTDADGDTDSNSFDLSDDVFQIEDDGPTQPTLNGEFSGSLVVDESPVGADEGGDNAPAGVRSASGDFSGAFGAVTLGSFGTDGPLGGTVADGTSYALDLSSEGIASGLYALGVGGAQGAAIELYTALDGSIEGRVGGAMGTLYFTISVDSTGVVTFTQEDGANVWHSNTGSDDDTSYLNIDVEDGSLHLVQTLTDADGDTDSNSFDLSDDVFQIEDDGPSVTDEPQSDVNEGGMVSGEFDFNAGTDGGGVSHVNGIALVFDGMTGWSQSIDIGPGSIRVKADGSYEFTAENPAASGPVNGTFTVTDGDGDHEIGNFSFNIVDQNVPTAGTASARLDDDGLYVPADAASNGETGDIDANFGEVATTNPNEAIFHGALNASFGGDGPGAVSFASMDGTFAMVGTERVIYSWNAATLTLQATVAATDWIGNPQDRAGDPLFKLVMDNPTSVNYTLTLQDNVLHTDDNANDEASAPNVQLTFTISDSDTPPGSEAVGHLNIEFNDDIPQLSSVAAASSVSVDETSASPGGFPIMNTSASAMITATKAFGADGAGPVNGGIAYGLAIVGGSPLLTSLKTSAGDHPITLVAIDGDTIQGQYQDGGTQVAFIIQMNSDGTVTLTQNVALEHSVQGGPAGDASHNDFLSLSGLINATITITDGDGDEASASAGIGNLIKFLDDGPDVGLALTGTQIRIDETDGVVAAGGEVDPVGGNLGTVTVLGSSLFTVTNPHVSADSPTSYGYSFVLGTPDVNGRVDSGLDLSTTNANIYLYVSADGLTVKGSTALTSGAVVTGNTVFTATIDPTTGNVTLTQYFAVEHTNTASNDEDSLAFLANALQVRLIATDADVDTDIATVDLGSVIVFEDDGPRPFTPDSVAAFNGNTAPITGSLNVNLGSDGYGSYTFDFLGNGGTLNNGIMARDAAGNLLKVGGAQLYLYGDGTNVLTATTAANGVGGTIGYTITLNADGTYAFDVNATIQNGTSTEFTDLTNVKSGNVGYLALGADSLNNNPGNIDILLSARGGTVNTSQTGIGVQNQSVNGGQAVRIDIVNGLVTDGGQASGFNYTGHYETRHFEQLVSQTQSGAAVNVKVYAILADDDQNFPNTTANILADGETFATITKVYIDPAGAGTRQGVDITGLAVGGTLAIGTTGVSVTKNSDGSVTFNGMHAGDQYGIDTSNDFNAVLVEHPDDQPKSFDINIFSVDSASAGTQMDLNIPVVATDSDGDPVSSILQTVIVPVSADNKVGDNNINTGAGIDGNASDNVLAGNGGNDVINGGDGSDVLYGNAGNDTLNGGAGNDILTGGVGADILTGGTGNDVFVLSNAAITNPGIGNIDTIMDYAAGDVIDITQILKVSGGTNVTTGGYVRVTTTGLVQVDVTGNGDGAQWVTVSNVNTGVGSYSIRYTDGATTNTVAVAPVAPPVVLDLHGDGLHFLGVDEGVTFGGYAMAWAGPDDAILVRDANGNGLVDDASEITFATSGTDLEGLHAMYGDQLDASDADFTMFALWQDANSNGIVDEGEMMSLAEAGIASISLVSDGVSYSAANGDVYVAGTATFTRTDGSTGDAADSLFSTGLVSTTQEVERIAANSNTTVLAAALAAAGLASSVPAAAATADLGNASDANALDVTIGAASAGGTVDTGSATSAASLVGAIVEAVAVTAPGSASAFDPGVTANAGDLITAAVLDGGVSELAQGTDAPASQMAIPTVAAVVAMPSADALAAMADGQAQHSGVVEKVLAEALDGGHSDQVDALLNALPANENGANPSLAIVASGGDVDVPTWHMGMDAGFTASMDHGISIEATMLHHDAIQPVVNG